MNNSSNGGKTNERKQISESDLFNMLEDFSEMPNCSERIIMKLIYDLSKNNLDDINSAIGNLNERLKIENLYYENKDIVDNIAKSLKNSNINEALGHLLRLQKKTRFLNIQEVIRLVKSNDEYTEIIKDKNIYILFGLTGTGKSTTLHFLGGSKFKLNQQNHLEPYDIFNKDLEAIKTSANMASETRHVIPVRIQAKTGIFSKEEIYLCDSPGFQDSNGPEIDISNSITIQRTVEACQGIKPIIILSKLMGKHLP